MPESRRRSGNLVKVNLPNSARLQNIDGFLRHLDLSDTSRFEFSMHSKWTSVHPLVISMAACAASLVEYSGGRFTGAVSRIASANYLVRMKLFDHIRLSHGIDIHEHEESGRFIPLTQIRDSAELRAAIANLVPLLHAPVAVADPIQYVFSELVRNVLEHAESPVGAFVCAQYYKEQNKVAIGIADGGMGILNHMARFHHVETSKEAITLALQPGISGTTSRPGGTETNAGAGLFFTKSIAALSRNYFVLHSGDTAFKLLTVSPAREPELHGDPTMDKHRFIEGLPKWPGTAVGIDLSVTPTKSFADLLDQIRDAFFRTRKKKKFSAKIRFTK